MAGKSKSGNQRGNSSGQVSLATQEQSPARQRDLFSFLIFCPVLLAVPFYLGQQALRFLYLTATLLGAIVVIYLVPKLLKRESLVYNFADVSIAFFVAAYLVSVPTALDLRMAIDGFLYASTGLFAYWLSSRLSFNSEYTRIISGILLASAVCLSVLLFAYRTESVQVSGFLAENLYSLASYRNITAAYFSALAILGIGVYLSLESFFLKSMAAAATTLLLASATADPSKGTAMVLVGGMVMLIAGLPTAKRVETVFSLLYLALLGITAGHRMTQAMVSRQPESGWIAMFSACLLGIFISLLWPALSNVFQKTSFKTRSLIAAITIAAFLTGTASVIISLTSNSTPLIIQKTRQIINTGDVSYTSRADFYKDALEIIADYPLLGTGAGGWNLIYHKYQDYLYWSAKVHSFPLQVGVETGLFGMAALTFLIIMLIRYGWNLWKSNYSVLKGKKTSCLEWAIFTTLIMMLSHSMIDFDMSGAFFYIVFFTLLGVFTSPYTQYEGELITIKQNRWGEIIILFVSFLVIFTSLQYYLAIKQTERGYACIKTALSSNGIEYLQKSLDFDPWNSMYHLNLAKAYAIRAAEEDESPAYYYQQALTEAQKAEKLSKYNLETIYGLMKFYQSIGYTAGMEKLCLRALSLNPWDVNQYANVILVYTDSAYSYATEGDLKTARARLNRVFQTAIALENQIRKIPANKKALWKGNPLEFNGNIKFSLARAYYLSGQYEKTLELLDKYRIEENSSSDVQVIYASSLARLGRIDEADKIIANITRTSPQAQQTYQQLTALPVVKLEFDT